MEAAKTAAIIKIFLNVQSRMEGRSLTNSDSMPYLVLNCPYQSEGSMFLLAFFRSEVNHSNISILRVPEEKKITRLQIFAYRLKIGLRKAW